MFYFSFMTHMRELVNRNLVIARVGGVPGTLTLVDGYLNVKHLQSDKLPCQVERVFCSFVFFFLIS